MSSRISTITIYCAVNYLNHSLQWQLGHTEKHTCPVWISWFPLRMDETVIYTSPMWYVFDMEGGELAQRWSPTPSQTQGQILWAYTHDRSHLGLLIRYLLEPSLAVNQSFQPLILTEVSQLRHKDKTGASWGVEAVRWWGDFFTSQLDMFGMTVCAI